MKRNENQPLSSGDADERILKSIRAQQRGLKWLTGITVGFWVVAVLTSVGVLIAYCVLYATKEKQIMTEYESSGHLLVRTNSPAGSQPAGRMDTDRALALHFVMNAAVTRGLLITAVSVIAISAGTLTTLLLVILNRRVTLKQINHSLAQISKQLKELQPETARIQGSSS
jgi:hypothetical protein